MQFVIFHGAYGSPDGNWFPQLQDQLEDLGQEVLAPQFPVDTWDNVVKQGKHYRSPVQNLGNWLKVFEDQVLPWLKQGEKACFIGHSLGPVFILHVVQKYKLQLDSAIFVSPFLGPLEQWEFNAVNDTFYKQDFDFKLLKKLIPNAYVLYSDNDPYVPQNQPKEFAAKLDAALIPVRKAGHINSEVNLNEFPLVFDLCTTRLDLTLWQQYLAHRKRVFGIDFFNEHPDSMVLFKPDEIMDWQIFLDENLQKHGFCTFYTGRRSWDPHDKYFEDARAAAKRIESFTRVFFIERRSDLDKPLLREQVQLDMAAGIQVYFCSLSYIVDKIPELDFGIWDDRYLCVVKFDEEKALETVQINTHEADLQKAGRWRRIILDQSVRVTNMTDVITFQKTMKEDVIFLTPEEIADEGTFKFRHLKNEGFCTLYTSGAGFWGTQSAYMRESRHAAHRVKNVTRVYVFEQPGDLRNTQVTQQVHDDLEAGIKVYVCPSSEVRKDLHAEPDFGIWDNEYVCIVNFDDKNQATHARLSSLTSDIDEASEWKRKILEHATPVRSVDDLHSLITA